MNKQPETAIGITALARALGRRQPTVTEWLRHPKWTFGPNSKGKVYDVDAVRKWAAANLVKARPLGSVVDDKPLSDDDLRPAATSAATRARERIEQDTPAEAGDIQDRMRQAKLAKTIAEAALIETKKLVAEGRFIPREVMEREWAAWCTTVHSLFIRVAHEVAKANGFPMPVELAYDKAIRAQLHKIAEQARGLGSVVHGSEDGGTDRTASEDDAE